jgi:hypothetical protein
MLYVYALCTPLKPNCTELFNHNLDYRQTYKAKHYINSLKHVIEVLKIAQENKKALGKINKYM